MLVIGLGFLCYLKDVIKNTKYNKETDVFDWMNNYYFDKCIESLENKFNISQDMKLSHLEADRGTKVLYNIKYDFRLPHDNEYFTNRRSFEDKYNRRYERFMNYKKTNDTFIFIRLANVRGRYGKEKEELIDQYSEKNYNRFFKLLPEKSHIIILIDEKIDKEIKEKFYYKFIILEDIVHPGFIAGGPTHKYKNNLLKAYNKLFDFCRDNFDNLLDLKEEMNRMISMDIINNF